MFNSRKKIKTNTVEFGAVSNKILVELAHNLSLTNNSVTSKDSGWACSRYSFCNCPLFRISVSDIHPSISQPNVSRFHSPPSLISIQFISITLIIISNEYR